MVLFKLCLCVFFAITTKMVDANAHEKLMTLVVEELEKDVHKVTAKLENLKYTLQHNMARTERLYHTDMDKFIADAELRIEPMLCKDGTVDKVKAVRKYGWGSFQECVNLTKAVADGEVVMYDTVVFLENLLKLIANVTKDLGQCRHQSPFNALHCVVETIANHSHQYQEKCDDALSLLNRMDNITQKLYKTFRGCIGTANNTVRVYVDNIIADNCKEHSFLRQFLNAFRTKLTNRQQITSLKQTHTEEGNRQKTPTEEENRLKTTSQENKN